MYWKTRTRAAAAGVVVITALGLSLLAAGPASAAVRKSGPRVQHPLVTHCVAGPSYTVITSHGAVFDGFGTAFVDHNGGSTTVTFTTTISATGTAELTLSAGGSFNLDAIVADAQGSASATLDVSVSVSGSHTVSIGTPPGQWAVAQFGDWRFYNYGNYEVVTSDCTVTTNVDTYTWIPENAVGYDTTTNSTGAVPWQQDNS